MSSLGVGLRVVCSAFSFSSFRMSVFGGDMDNDSSFLIFIYLLRSYVLLDAISYFVVIYIFIVLWYSGPAVCSSINRPIFSGVLYEFFPFPHWCIFSLVIITRS